MGPATESRFPSRPHRLIPRGANFLPMANGSLMFPMKASENEVYVAPFTGSGGKKQISSAGGDQPTWRGDGKEIFYVAPNGQMTAVAGNSSGGSMELGTARPLFGSIPPPLGHVYDVSKDGARFLVRVEVQADEPLTLMQNWTGLLMQ
jgi:hypothetical protein